MKRYHLYYIIADYHQSIALTPKEKRAHRKRVLQAFFRHRKQNT